MLRLIQRIHGDAAPLKQPAASPDGILRLPFQLRQKSRFRAELLDGTAVGVVLDRGLTLRHGDYLLAEDGRMVLVEAAQETVSTVVSADAVQLARAAYHLGNRHVPLQIGDGFVRYLHDHVLDAMVRGLGLPVRAGQAPFEPESGAYGGGHGHSHEHDHEQGAEHSHGHAHQH